MRVLIFAALAAVALPQVATAAPNAGAVPAERELRRQLYMTPGDPLVMAQLAGRYAEAGRTERAERLYRALLRDEEVQLVHSGGSISSHDLARAALDRMAKRKPIQLSAR